MEPAPLGSERTRDLLEARAPGPVGGGLSRTRVESPSALLCTPTETLALYVSGTLPSRTPLSEGRNTWCAPWGCVANLCNAFTYIFYTYYVYQSYMSATWETVGFSTVSAHLWDAPHHEAAPFHPHGNATAGERGGGFHFSWEGGGLCVYI